MSTELPPLPKAAHMRRQSQPNGAYCLVPAYTEAEMRAYAAAAVAAERELQRDRVKAHIGRSVMSVYSTVVECKAARDALRRLLDEMAQDQKGQG